MQINVCNKVNDKFESSRSAEIIDECLRARERHLKMAPFACREITSEICLIDDTADPSPVCSFSWVSSTLLVNEFHEWTCANSPTIILEKKRLWDIVTQAQILTDRLTLSFTESRWGSFSVRSWMNIIFSFFTTDPKQMPIILSVCISCLHQNDELIWDFFTTDLPVCPIITRSCLSPIRWVNSTHKMRPTTTVKCRRVEHEFGPFQERTRNRQQQQQQRHADMTHNSAVLMVKRRR